jgi:subtilisin family serine protease
MAAPQVAGVVALYLSRNPKATPAQARAWVAKTGIKGQVLSSVTNNDWTNQNALLGGPNNFLFNPYRNNFKDAK